MRARIRHTGDRKDEGLPPSPPVSRLQAMRLLRRDPIALFEAGAAVGDVAFLRLPRFPVYLLNHPDLVWDVLATNSRSFRKGPTMQAARRMLGDGLLTSEGEVHRTQRRLIQPIFHHERIAGYGEAMVGLADRASERWGPNETLDVHAEMSRLTLAIVARTLFDADVEAGQAREIGAALSDVLAQFNRVFSPLLPITERLPVPSTLRFNRARDVFDRAIHGMIERRRRAGAAGEDLLSLLLRAREDGVGMTDAQVRDEAVTLYLAGHETTSNALTWTWYLLSRHPEAEAGLHAEVDEVLGGRPPAVTDLPRLPYTGMVLSESLRLYPPAWAIGRRATRDHRARGHAIARGSVVVVSPWLLHRDPRWWPDPTAFRPERWREEAGRPRHAYLPFGGGPRMCIGEGFALMEARLLLAAIARRWRLELDPTQPVATQPVITLRPRFGMRMRALPRRGGGAPAAAGP